LANTSASETSPRNNIVGQRIQLLHDLIASSCGDDRVSEPVLSVRIEEADCPVSCTIKRVVESASKIVQGSEVPNRILNSGNVIEVKWINSVLALLVRAVWTAEPSVALALHGGLLVPELVDVAAVSSSELSDTLANTMAGARVGARSTLACNAVIAVKALALASGAIAITLVGALHVIVG